MGIKTKGNITSRLNPLICDAVKLRDKKYRDETGEYFFEGIKLFSEAVFCGVSLSRVFVTEAAILKYSAALEKTEADIFTVPESVYEKITLENAPQGVFTVAYMNVPEHAETGLIMMLDCVADPGNVGTVIRCADAFGAEAVYLGEGCADLYNPKTVRAAMGSVFRVPAVSVKLTEKIKELVLSGYSVYTAMLEKSSVSPDTLLKGARLAFVVGNEGHGVSDKVRNECTGSVFIPMRENGAESLNAAVASSVLLWEHRRV